MPSAIRAKQALTPASMCWSARLPRSPLAGFGSLAKPYLSRAADRPLIACGIQSGDVTANSAMIWARADRAARMQVECSTARKLSRPSSAPFLPMRCRTATSPQKCCSMACRAGQDIFYRVRFDDIASGIAGETQVGHFRTAPAERRSVSFVWSGDAAGQGWGIDPARGGIADLSDHARQPAGLLHSFRRSHLCRLSGAVGAEAAERRDLAQHRDGGKIRRRAQPRAVPRQLQIQLARRQLSRFPRRSPDVRAMGRSRGDQRLVAARQLRRERLCRGRRPETGDAGTPSVPRIHADARSRPSDNGRVYRRIGYGPLLDVFMLDMRSYRDNTWNKRDDNSDTFILGPAQLAWLKRELVASNATWKVIAADMSIGLISEDAVALGDGPPERREHEIADLLSFMKRAGIRNTVWLTADMHYTAAHHYDPNRAVFQDFEPFWEFVSGPLHAGTWSPGDLDNTFGPEGDVPEGLQRGAGRQSRALLWAAVFRPRRDRRQNRSHDRDAEGCRKPAIYGRSISSPVRMRGPARSWRSISERRLDDSGHHITVAAHTSRAARSTITPSTAAMIAGSP